MLRSILILYTLLSFSIDECALAQDSPPTASPRLILFLVIDQARYEYFDRFKEDLEGGLKYVRDHGVWFQEAHHQHTPTTTAPGHATLISGAYPRRSGIVDNQWYDRAAGKVTTSVTDRRYGKSPTNLLVSSFPDWLKAADEATRVFTVSGKDRGAILLGGKSANGAFWSNREKGIFESSEYYGATPYWLEAFNEKKPADQYFGQLWRPLIENPSRLKNVGILDLDRGVFKNQFPHALGTFSLYPDSTFYGDLAKSPYLDQLTLDLAREIVLRENLGSRSSADFLGVSLSALDLVGHEFGPHSREVYDTFRRLDRALGVFLQFLISQMGSERLVIALSSDHGVISFPEANTLSGVTAKRLGADEVQCAQQLASKLQQRFGTADLFLSDELFDTRKLAQAGLSDEQVSTFIAEELQKCPDIARVITKKELLGTPRADDPALLSYQRGYYESRSPDFMVVPKPNVLPTLRDGTTHLTPYPYDTHVPLAFVVPGMAPRAVTGQVSTVDTAPTLAKILRLRCPDNLDGRPLL